MGVGLGSGACFRVRQGESPSLPPRLLPRSAPGCPAHLGSEEWTLGLRPCDHSGGSFSLSPEKADQNTPGREAGSRLPSCELVFPVLRLSAGSCGHTLLGLPVPPGTWDLEAGLRSLCSCRLARAWSERNTSSSPPHSASVSHPVPCYHVFPVPQSQHVHAMTSELSLLLHSLLLSPVETGTFSLQSTTVVNIPLLACNYLLFL